MSARGAASRTSIPCCRALTACAMRRPPPICASIARRPVRERAPKRKAVSSKCTAASPVANSASLGLRAPRPMCSDAEARFPTNRCAEHRAQRGVALSRHEADRSQDRGGVSTRRDRSGTDLLKASLRLAGTFSGTSGRSGG